MESTTKIFLFCVVFYVTLCSADDNPYRTGEACLVQYLKGKGKLNDDFQSALPATPQCRLVIPITLQILKSAAKTKIGTEIPNEADCLVDEFDSQELIEYPIKVDLIEHNKFLDATVRTTQLDETRNQFKDMLEKVAVQCLVDSEKFVQLFNNILGIKNETMAAYQHQYCLAKYAVDNALLQIDKLEINPHNIDPESVNCDYIIDVERSKSETELRDKISETSTSEQAVNCILNAYTSANGFGWQLAVKVLEFVDISAEVKEQETNRISIKIGQFALSSFMCALG